jgi:hypothetical protein
MNTLPLDCLVANFLACECRSDTVEDEEGIYSIPLDDTHWIGVQASEMDDSLVFFAHPGPEVESQTSTWDDKVPSEQLSEELEVGEDADGNWVLTADRSSGRYTLWLRTERQQVGHPEFARIVENLRWRFAVWDEVLADRNDSSKNVTQTVPLALFQETPWNYIL